MKKLICIILCLMMLILCAACGSDDSKSAESTEAATEAMIYPVSASWFDDAVFVGDSITLKLSYYCDNNEGVLGEAEFYCAGSLGYNSALWDLDDPNAVHPEYRGEIALTEYCAEKTDSSKVFLMLGMNDIGLYGVDGAADGCRKLVDKIKSHTPDVKIYLQSVTPMLKEFEYEDLTNANIDKFNEWLKGYCEENGYTYLDINSIVRDSSGALDPVYCSDPDAMGIHFTDEACAMWVDYLKNHV